MPIKRIRLVFRATLLVAATLFAAPSMASTITVNRVGFSDGWEAVSVSDVGNFGAGRFALTTSTSATVFAWCVDLFRSINIGGGQNIIYTLGGLNGPPLINPDAVTALTVGQISRVTGLAAYGNAQLALSPSDSVLSAAVQGAIWQTLTPSSVVSSSNNMVQSLLATLQDTAFAGTGGSRLGNLNQQNLLVAQTLFTGGIPVPVPGAMSLFAVALLCGFVATRRRAAQG